MELRLSPIVPHIHLISKRQSFDKLQFWRTKGMLGNEVHPPEQPSMDQVSSPLSAQILEFCESELFPETIQNSEVASSSNCCYEDQSSYTTNLSSTFPQEIIRYPTHHPIDNNNNNNGTKVPTTITTNNNFSIIFDEEEITENNPHLSGLPRYQFGLNNDDFDISLLQNQIPLTDHNVDTINAYADLPHSNDHVVPIMGPALPTVCEDDCLSSMPPSKFMRLNKTYSPNCSFMDTSVSYPPLPVESSAIFNGNLFMGNEIQPHDLDFKGDNGSIFCPDPLSRPFNSNELQALSNESQHLVNGGGSSCVTPLVSEITSTCLEADTFRVTTKLTTEERKEKIHRYMKKRNQRNFSKKIKYACRKTLADSRPRVRGRFAKNDEYGDINRTTCSNHEEDTDEDVKTFRVVVKEEEVLIKEEEQNFESPDIFSHISGVNSLQLPYPVLDLMNLKKGFVA